MKDALHKTEDNQRTEEVQDIIEKMPTKFGYLVSLIVFSLFSLLLIFGYAIRYPDVITGKIIINGDQSPVSLVAQASGRLQLNNIVSKSKIKKDEILAYIENSTSFESYKDVSKIMLAYENYDISPDFIDSMLLTFPKKVSLGELNSKYYNFLNCLTLLSNFNSNALYDKQIENYKNLIHEQEKEIINNENKITLNKQIYENFYNNYLRDSALFSNKAAARIEYEKSYIDYLSSQNNHKSALTNYINSLKEIKQTNSQITQVSIQKMERKKELELSLASAFHELEVGLKQWEIRYLFKAPFDGELQFLKFWSGNQNIKEGEQVFSIIPEKGQPYGQLHLPATGAGKVKLGQEVNVKLDDFPYIEYGFISGQIIDIANISSTETTAQGEYETYLITVQFNNGITTNYGKVLNFKQASRGIGEVVTTDRNLIQRIIGSLRSITNK